MGLPFFGYQHLLEGGGGKLATSDEEKVVDEQANHAAQETVGYEANPEAIACFVPVERDFFEVNEGSIVPVRGFAEGPEICILEE